jgi:uncharacterized repeat protein (TIGR03803 family)
MCALWILFSAAHITLSGQTFKTVLSFNGSNGNLSFAPLVQGTNGSLYGTSQLGGFGEGGNVFQLNGQGATAYSLCSQDQCTGADPIAGLVQARNGDFYGTTEYGGTNDDGTVFRMTPGGTFTSVHSFDTPIDGTVPVGLIATSSGELYGVTQSGGSNGVGTLFRISASGDFKTLYNFCSKSNCLDGTLPAGVIQATDGNFYGTTSYGGNISCGGPNGCGTVFRITPSGNLTTIYTFCLNSGCEDGAFPISGVIQASDTTLYGTTETGGSANGGTVFKLTLSGTLTTLHSFCAQSQCPDGLYPKAGLLHATDGNFYGTTSSGGLDFGTIFRITSTGNLTTLHSFSYPEGENPMAQLIEATNGVLYGTTLNGGVAGVGTVFSLSLNLSPFVEAQTSSGEVGEAVNILGNSLTGASSVTFNGVPAAFAVPESSVITTTVPAGATTGKIEVVTPGGTLTSNASFIVLP